MKNTSISNMILLPFLLLILVLMTGITACCDDDDDDDDDNDDDDVSVEDIIAIVREMTEGHMARTPEGLEEKVFPHLSEDYERAGFNKEEAMEDALEELEDNPWLHTKDYDLQVEVDIGDNGKTALATTVNVIEMSIEAHDDIEFESTIDGTISGVNYFEFEEDNQWRVVTVKPLYSTWNLHGGDQNYAVDIESVEIDQTEIAPGDSVTVSGQLTLPDIEEGDLLYMSVNVNWQDDRYNAVDATNSSEVYYLEEKTEGAGTTYDFAVTMPDDGEPQGQAAPDVFPRGTDTLEVNVHVFSFNEDSEMLCVDARIFLLPIAPITNADPCEPGLDETADGVWALSAQNVYFNLFEMLDLRVVGDDVYGTVLYGTVDAELDNIVAGFEITGEIDGDQITFGYEDAENGFSVEYEAMLSGTEMINGAITYDVEGEQTFLQFTGDKLDNRCEGMPSEELNGERLLADIGENSTEYLVSVNGYEVTMTGGGTTWTGFTLRNILVTADQLEAEHYMLFGFYDTEGGYAAEALADTLEAGTVTVL